MFDRVDVWPEPVAGNPCVLFGLKHVFDRELLGLGQPSADRGLSDAKSSGGRLLRAVRLNDQLQGFKAGRFRVHALAHISMRISRQ